LLRAEALAEVVRPQVKQAHIPVLEIKAGEHLFGSYRIQLERQGAGFSYNVSTAGGSLVSAGFDLLSHTEQAALEGITARLSGKGNGHDMKKTVLFSALILFFLAGWLCPQAAAITPQVTISATSTTLLGVTVPISLNCALIDPNQTGSMTAGGGVITVPVTNSVTPGVTTTCGPLWGQDVIKDAFGNTNTTYYLVNAYVVTNGIIASTPSATQAYQFAGSGTFDLSTTLPFALGPVSPAGSVLGLNLTFTGNDNATGLWNFTGGLQNNGVAVPVLPINLATQVTGTLAGANYAAVNLAAGNVNGGATGVLPGANMAATNLAGGNNPGGVTGILPNANLTTQGTDANLLTSGTVSASTGVALCTDANHGATTSGCSTGIAVNQSDQTLLSANSGTITLTTPGANGFYQLDCYVVETRAATTSSTLPQCQVLYTDADSSAAFTFQLTNTTSINSAGVAGQPLLQPWMFYAKSGVAIQYNSTGYLSNGATSMQYAMHVRLLGPF